MGACTSTKLKNTRNHKLCMTASTMHGGACDATSTLRIDEDIHKPRKGTSATTTVTTISGLTARVESIKDTGVDTVEPHVSCFMSSDMASDPIGRIARLEQSCIRLKSYMEKEKQIKIAAQIAKPRRACDLVGLSQNSTRHSIDHKNTLTIDPLENDINCYMTIIKLADFVQEKSQRLWDNPNDEEIIDALGSLFWAAKMLQIPCLIDFQTDVAKEIEATIQPNLPVQTRDKQVTVDC